MSDTGTEAIRETREVLAWITTSTKGLSILSGEGIGKPKKMRIKVKRQVHLFSSEKYRRKKH